MYQFQVFMRVRPQALKRKDSVKPQDGKGRQSLGDTGIGLSTTAFIRVKDRTKHRLL